MHLQERVHFLLVPQERFRRKAAESHITSEASNKVLHNSPSLWFGLNYEGFLLRAPRVTRFSTIHWIFDLGWIVRGSYSPKPKKNSDYDTLISSINTLKKN